MHKRCEADKESLELVQSSLQASAKEAERLATRTRTRLVRSTITEPAVLKDLAPLLTTLSKSGTSCHESKGRAHG